MQALGISRDECCSGPQNTVLGVQTRAWGKGQGRLPKGSDRLLANFSVLGCLLEYHFINMMKHILFYLSWRVFCFVFVYTRDRCFNQVHFGHYLNYLPLTPVLLQMIITCFLVLKCLCMLIVHPTWTWLSNFGMYFWMQIVRSIFICEACMEC